MNTEFVWYYSILTSSKSLDRLDVAQSEVVGASASSFLPVSPQASRQGAGSIGKL